MSKIVQLISHNGKLLALSDEGKIYAWEAVFAGHEEAWDECYLSLEASEAHWEYVVKEIRNDP